MDYAQWYADLASRLDALEVMMNDAITESNRHDAEILDVNRRIRSYENDTSRFFDVVNDVIIRIIHELTDFLQTHELQDLNEDDFSKRIMTLFAEEMIPF